jgi:hypothetical protein
MNSSRSSNISSSLSVDFGILHALSAELLSTILETLDSVEESLVVLVTDDELGTIDRQSKSPEVIDDVCPGQQGKLKKVDDTDDGMI